jgi:hypothetical protein
MERLPDDAKILTNRDVLQFLERQARPAKPAYASYDIDEYELHTHPDLIERLAEAAAGLDAPMVAVYGVPVLMHRNHVIFAAAYSMSTLIYRLPTNLHSRVAPARWTVDIGAEWVAANGWLSDLPSREGTERIREWSRWAYEYAARLGHLRRS